MVYMLEISVLIITALINLILGLLVYLKNPKSLTNKLFFSLVAIFTAWMIVNFISLRPIWLEQIYWVRLVLFFAVFLTLFLYLTFKVFPSTKYPGNKKKLKALVLVTSFVALLTLTPYVFSGLKISNNTATPIPGPGIVFFGLTTISLITASIVVLVRKLMSATGFERNQLKFVLFGIVASFTLIVSTNLILVVLYNQTQFLSFAPLFTLLFSASFAYAVIKHHLMDIRAIVARSVAYVLLLATVIGLYSASIFIISDVFIATDDINIDRALYIGLSIIFGLTLPLLKNQFDRLTQTIFYHDSYDPQKVIDRITDILASQIDISIISEGTLQSMVKNLKAGAGTIVVMDKDKIFKQFYYGHKKLQMLPDELKRFKKDIVVIDDLSPHSQKRSIMDKHDVSVVVHLTAQDQTVGYLLLSEKKTGSIYTSQDISIFHILSNELAVALENARHFEQIKQFNITLQKKIDAATKELRDKNAKLKELDQAKDDFISMASHQLRTPLTTVKGYLSMVTEGDVGKVPQKQQKLIDRALTSAERMVFLISDLLNVSRMNTGKFVIDRTPTDLLEMVKGEIDQLKRSAKAKDIKFVADLPKTFPIVMLDENKTRQVMMNFMDNAIYYTPNGGTVTVKLEKTRDSIEFKVIDTGIGVPDKVKDKLFTKFFRAPNAQKARPDGTGLGIYMAKKVITAQGGFVIFESQEGVGSTFGFRFALANVAAKGKRKKSLNKVKAKKPGSKRPKPAREISPS